MNDVCVQCMKLNFLNFVENNKVDLIVMDLGLPNMNGIETTKQIRSANKDIKVVVLTSHNDEKEVLNSIKAGANASDARLLNFIPLKRPIKITGRFGYWIKEDDNEYLSYEPYNDKN